MIIYPNSGALWGAGLLRTGLANALIKLFKAGAGISVNPALTLTQLEAAEADYTGYAPITVATFTTPLLNPVAGASVSSGTQQFQIAAPYTVANVIGGGWIESAGGVLVAAWDFDPTRTLAMAGDGIPFEFIAIFG